MDHPDDETILETVRGLEPHEFEDFVAALWELQGWDTKVTGQSGDRGIDIIATRSFPFEIEAHIQAKRYGEDSQVSSPEMQKYGSLARRQGVDLVVVVTSGSFTSEAIRIAEEFNIKLLNAQSLVSLIEELGAEELLTDYIGETELGRADFDTEYIDSTNTGFNPSNTTADSVSPTSTVTSGDWLRLELVGAEWVHKQGSNTGDFAEQMANELSRSIDGLVLAFEITNLRDKKWEFHAKNLNSDLGIVGFDTDGVGYEAVWRSNYRTSLHGDVSAGWNWGETIIRAQSRGKVATWLDVPKDTKIVSVEYEEEIWRGIDDYEDHRDTERLRLSFPQPVESVVGDLPEPIKQSI